MKNTNIRTNKTETTNYYVVRSKPFGMVNGVGPINRVSDGRAHWRYLANIVERLCAAAIEVGTSWLAMRPVPKLLWTVLFSHLCSRILCYGPVSVRLSVA